MARVQLMAEAEEDLNDLDGAAQALVVKALKKLRTEPEKRGAPLGRRSDGDLTTFRKLVVGNKDYRIVYRVEPNGDVVVIWVIAGRADAECYELALGRLKLHGGREAASLAETLSEVWRDLEDVAPGR